MHTFATDHSTSHALRSTRRMASTRGAVSRAGRLGRLPAVLAVALAPWFMAGCTEPVEATPIVSLRITPQVDSFYIGRASAEKPFAISFFSANNTDITDNRAINYTSTAPDVFTVDSRTGVITGKVTGSGFFRASVSGKQIEAGVKIIHAVDRIQLLPGDFGLNVGSTRQLQPNVYAADNTTISGRAITFASSNPAVASVSPGGVVTGVSEGTATMTVTSETKQASVLVTVAREQVSSIRLTPTVAQLMRRGGQLQVTATPLNSSGQPLTDRIVTWETNNPQVAVVNSQGVVTALGVGNATITAVVETRTAPLGISVTEIPPRTITLEPDTFQLATNLVRQLVPVVIDSAGNVSSLNNRTVLWQSTSSIVASVSQAGVVTGVAAGTARISVLVDGVRSNDAVVLVTPQVATVRITPFNPQILRIGTTVQLSAQALDNANQVIPGKVANWFSNNPTIASVSPGGLVSGVSVGTTTITAEIDNRTSTLQVTVTLVPVGSVTLPALDTLVENDVRQYNPVVRDTAGKVITSLLGRSVIFQSNNLPVATVSNQGVANGVAQGTATFVATVDGVSSNDMTLRVARITTVTIAPTSATVAVGATQALTVTLKDAAGNVLNSSRPITFSSTSSAIASVTQAGVVTGVATGTATIFASINGISGSIVVTVP